ncbi:hypothetical protein NCS56_00476800 [Fusarium sp. Ph1]|nr:hypothetical protein NCS56_00476800 [Fusarium sp. Ph1]
MKPVIFITALSTLLTPAASRCSMNNRWCYWDGVAPACGSTSYNLGDIDGSGKVLKAWTKDQDHTNLCYTISRNSEKLSGSCCRDYGSGCWGGYKRLWCEVDE